MNDDEFSVLGQQGYEASLPRIILSVPQLMSLSGAEPRLAVRTGLNAMHGRLSPNGRWLAYASDESGQLQVYVQPFPASGEKRQISPDGGAEPRALFDARVPLTGSPYRTTYTATADGRRFLVNTRTDDVPMPINIVFPWTALLKR